MVYVELADLRALHTRNRRLMEYGNVICHTSDILLELASRYIPEGIPERALMNDAFQIGREATQNVLATATANHQSHVIYERLLLEQRDTRKHVTNLDSRLKAQARVMPSDSDQYILGTEHTRLEKDLKDHVDRNKFYSEGGGGARAVPAASTSTYTGRSANAAKSSRGHGQAKKGGGKSSYQQDYKKDKPYNNSGNNNDNRNDRRGNRGRGRGNRDQK